MDKQGGKERSGGEQCTKRMGDRGGRQALNTSHRNVNIDNTL